MSNKAWDAGRRGSAGGEHVDHLLSPYIDNDLDADARSQVRKHLQECADCRADYIELQATHKLLGRLPTVVPPRAFTITPEMAQAASPRPAAAASASKGFWERLFSPRNAPRYAFGSLASVVLTVILLAGGLTLGNHAATVSSLTAQSLPASDSSLKSPPAFGVATPGDGSRNNQQVEQTPPAIMALAPTPAAGGSGGAGGGGSASSAGALPSGGAGGAVAGAASTIAAVGATDQSAGMPSTTGAAAAMATSTPAPPASDVITSAPSGGAAESGLSTNQVGSPTTTTMDGATSISPPAPEHSGTSGGSSPFDSTGGALFLSFGAIFGLASILLAIAALVSTRRS